MQNKHKEYIRISENKKTACLMVHGIVGTPRYFDRILPFLPEEWSIYNILLDGHGGTVKDFSDTSMKKWRNQVCDMLDMIREKHDEIYIVAHSLGTLLTINAVIDNPEKVKRMILFAIPLAPRVKPSSFVSSVKVALNIKTNDSDEAVLKKQYSVEAERRVWRYIGFIPRYIELLALISETKKKITMLDVPVLAFVHGEDEMVSPRAEKHIRRNAKIEICNLKSSTHNYFPSEDFTIVEEKIKELT